MVFSRHVARIRALLAKGASIRILPLDPVTLTVLLRKNYIDKGGLMTGLSLGLASPILRGYPPNFVFMRTVLHKHENTKIKLVKFESICDGVFGFMELISTDKRYKHFQDVLMHQWIADEIKFEELVPLIATTYAEDPGWGQKVLNTIKSLNLEN